MIDLEKLGPCAKQTVTCTLVFQDGSTVVGKNYCENPQTTCPRLPDEDYTKCKTICRQLGHAEHVATLIAGDKAIGARAYIEGHTYACMDCQHKLFAAGVRSLSVGKPVLEKE
jgi:hypothetical protein